AQSGVDYKIWETLTHFYDLQGWLPKNMVVVNKKSFDALDKAGQDAVVAAAKKAEADGWAASREVAEATKKELAAKGIKVMAPSKQLSDDLAKIGKILLDEWLKGAGPDGAALAAAFQK
ncbi:MAG: C4-dicarboxylate ABC transporter substrate-binding protein, partial [Alphaproteobacteria bacterium]|nr:C4-dicarboxylate ABC transporter substrate-binding protein [Alphaproteobacteria bacterium]